MVCVTTSCVRKSEIRKNVLTIEVDLVQLISSYTQWIGVMGRGLILRFSWIFELKND